MTKRYFTSLFSMGSPAVLVPAMRIIVLTWLHQGRRDVLRVQPRSNPAKALPGVFATRSPDRPNPVGLHWVMIRSAGAGRWRIGPIEAIDGAPVIAPKLILAAAD